MKRYRPEQIVEKLRQADGEPGQGHPVKEVCRKLEISKQTDYRWRQKYGGMSPELIKDHVRAYDFVSDRTEGGGQPKRLCVVDEYTRECLTIEAARRFTGRQVVDVLEELFAIRGRPAYLRSNNGPEFASKAVRRWLSPPSRRASPLPQGRGGIRMRIITRFSYNAWYKRREGVGTTPYSL